ncbi:MAG: phosphatase PAP2 family protein [Anaerolineaceae bacterium]|nr:phosphatase PAP2 family protein [Anaerolineaceae bacterium]
MSLQSLLEFDEKITRSIRLNDPDHKFKPFAAFFAHSGDSWFIEIALFILWLVSRNRIHQMLAWMAGCVVVLAVLVLGIKFLIRRQRPEGDWGAIYRNTDPHSFPSGHAARTAMLATLAFAFGPIWLGIAFVVWALLVSLARVWMGVHYLSDVLAGIVLGILFALATLPLAPFFFKWLAFVFSNASSLL